MIILVTGANGLIGRSILNHLSIDFNIVAVCRILPKKEDQIPNIRYISIDLSEDGVDKLLLEFTPDVIIHCAAIIPSFSNPDSQKVYDVNRKIDQNVLSIAIELQCYIIYFSSTIIYGILDLKYNIMEEDEAIAESFYAKQKIQSEKMITSSIKKYLILRVNSPYGFNMRAKTVLSIFVENALKGKTLFYYGSGSRMQDFTCVDDIGSFIPKLLKMKNQPVGIFNITNGNPISMKKLAHLIVKIAKSNSSIAPSGNSDNQENYKASYSIEKAKIKLGWKPQISLEKGLRALINNK